MGKALVVILAVIGAGVVLLVGGGFAFQLMNETEARVSGSGGGAAPVAVPAMPALPALPVTTTIVNESTEVSDNQLTGYEFQLVGNCSVKVSMTVESGDPVNMWVVDAVQYGSLKESHERVFSDGFRHYPALHASSARTHSAEGGLNPGSYVLVLREASRQNLLRRADTALVRVFLSKTCRSQ